MMKRLLLFLAVVFSLNSSIGQLLSWTPDFPKEASDPVVITLDANFGNKGLLNYANTNDVYVHIGVITTLSTSSGDWKHSKFTWATANPAAKATYIGSNKWTFTITGGLRSFFNITDVNESVLRIAILFRNGTGTTVQRNADGSDMFITVYTNAVATRFKTPITQPTYIPRPEPIVKNVGDNIAMEGISNQASAMKLYFNGTVVASSASAVSLTASPAITVAGNQTLVTEAKLGILTKRDTIQFYVPGTVVQENLPAGIRPGINYEADQTAVTLCLVAPGKNRVSVVGDLPNSNWVEQSQYQMKRTPDGKYWWLRITGLTPGTEYSYQFLVNGNLRIGDPYCEKVLDPWNDQYITSATYPNLKPYPVNLTSGMVSILQTAQVPYVWQTSNYTRPDKRKLIIYEMLMRDFTDAHDWQVMVDTLNYFQKLGVTAIEIMPFNEFEGNSSWGYNPDFYFAPDKYYGPEQSLKQFIDACHARGIAVVMDIALNHSFGLSPMVQLYWDSANNRPSPSNPWYNPVPKHPYNVGYDMNHESLDTRYFVSRVLEHWLVDYKVDGFRFDLSKGFTQTQTCDNNGENCNVGAWGNYDASRIAIWKRYYDTMQLKSPGSYTILEHFAANSEEQELSNYGMMLWGNSNANYSQAAIGYPSGPGGTWELRYNIFTERGWSNPYLITYMESHDEERLMTNCLNYGNASGGYNIKNLNTALKRMELCGAFLYTIPGPKMLWEFGELGYDYSINYCVNGTNSSDCRTDPKPVHWEYLAVPERKHLYDTWRALFALRKNSAWSNLFTSNQMNYNLTNAFKYFIVTSGNQKMVVVGNFDVVPLSGNVSMPGLANPATDHWYDYFQQANTAISPNAHTENFSLQPGEYRVLVSSPITIPVTIISFNGKKSGDFNILSWKVNNEIDVQKYVVERSADGVHFSQIGEVNANGASNYQYSDDIASINGNIQFYRLKSIDKDGQFSFSSIIKLVRNQRGWVIEVRPNPFTKTCSVQFESLTNENLKIRLTDLGGRVLLSKSLSVAPGSNIFQLPETASLSNGVYILTVESADAIKTFKVVKGN
ncbi:MAG: T9SS type A sorting domain-containing protein [Chitinophagaceae bacterium]|nr:T9SS type A sorting domain-containing protein [Bacteroidota bacterium]MCC6256779.1 T9SS type A sorting domain-containing protein [Chitinophagaceae bacterium]MCW5917039.1 T9SS type A sorting domain-containing protein [Ferruginibacter sp.]